jgi:hypothetical protein
MLNIFSKEPGWSQFAKWSSESLLFRDLGEHLVIPVSSTKKSLNHVSCFGMACVGCHQDVRGFKDGALGLSWLKVEDGVHSELISLLLNTPI